jgi:hypothetical protein
MDQYFIHSLEHPEFKSTVFLFLKTSVDHVIYTGFSVSNIQRCTTLSYLDFDSQNSNK